MEPKPRSMCDVGFVFSRRSVGVLRPQSHLFRHTGGNWGQARPEHRRANQRQASEIPFGFVTRTGQVRPGRAGISGSCSRSRTPASGAPRVRHSLQEWRSQSRYSMPKDFVFPSERLHGSKPLDLASVLKKKIQRALRRIGITGVGWHTFRHTVGTMLAEMGEHQLTIRDYLRHSNLHVTNKYLQATSKTKRLAQDKLVDAFLPAGLLPKPNLVQ